MFLAPKEELRRDVCFWAVPLNSYSTFVHYDVCRTTTGLRQWRFSVTTIGGNAAAEKCVQKTSTDEPVEECESDRSCRKKMEAF